MLAKVPSDQAAEVNITPAPPSFTAELNLDPSTFTNQFSLFDENNDPVANLVLITESTQQISITLVNATFSGEMIEWLLPPAGIRPTPSGIPGDNSTSFTVPQPELILAPWAFRLVVDDDTTGTQGIRSQTIFLTKPVGTEPESDELQYDASNGTFTLPGGAMGPQPVFLINAGLPGASAAFSVGLVTKSVPDGTSITFVESPVVWSSGSTPDWVNAIRSSSNLQNMTLTVSSSGGGQAIGFRFAIKITAGESTITVLSPDPILVNATIGDGT